MSRAGEELALAGSSIAGPTAFAFAIQGTAGKGSKATVMMDDAKVVSAKDLGRQTKVTPKKRADATGGEKRKGKSSRLLITYIVPPVPVQPKVGVRLVKRLIVGFYGSLAPRVVGRVRHAAGEVGGRVDRVVLGQEGAGTVLGGALEADVGRKERVELRRRRLVGLDCAGLTGCQDQGRGRGRG